MDTATVITFLQESMYFIAVFGVFLGYVMMRGKQALINLILSLYLALLISLEFPYFSLFLSNVESQKLSDSVIKIAIFVAFTIAGALLFSRLMPPDESEPAFEGFGKKLLFALLASVLVMAYSFSALSITDIITPGSPIQALFASPDNFFWWLLMPLVALMFL